MLYEGVSVRAVRLMVYIAIKKSLLDVLYNPGSLYFSPFSPYKTGGRIEWFLSCYCPFSSSTSCPVFHISLPLVSNDVVHFTPFKVSEILFRPVASRSMDAIPSFVRLKLISLSFCSVALDEYHSLFTLVPR